MATALVLGAGIVGVTMAYELWKDGHEVTVVDRETGAADFTSFGNAGMIAPGHAYAWASPASPGILLRSLWRNDQALRLKPTLDPAFLKWMWKFWGQCTAERAAENTRRKVRLCNYAQTVFHETRQQTGVVFDANEGETFEQAGYYPAKWNEVHAQRRRTLGWDLLDPYFDCLDIRHAEQREFVDRHERALMGFAVPVALVFAIPFIGPLLFGFAQAAGAVFVARELPVDPRELA